jgi:hypothetical protein
MSAAIFTISLSYPYAQAASVQYAASGASTQTGTILFPPGVVTEYLTIAVTQTTLSSSLSVMLSNPINCILGNTSLVGSVGIPGGSTVPTVSIAGGPLIDYGLITNAYNQSMGRGGYFHYNSGTSEGQSLMIYASYLAYEQLNGGDSTDQEAANFFITLASTMLDAMGNGSETGPLLRQPIPTDPNTICLLHWLFSARGPIPLQSIIYTFAASIVNTNQLVIPSTADASNVYNVWEVFPATSSLLYYSPYSPAFDKTTPLSDTTLQITNWTYNGTQVTVTLPISNPSTATSWYVVYGVNNATILPQGMAEEAYPCWTTIPDGQANCAPDTFRWFDYALTKAIEHDARPGKATDWTNLQNAMRMTVVKGMNLSDLRQIFVPLPGFPVFPLNGANPTGMFCYSNHPSALPPSTLLQSEGANAAWLGYNFWSRDTNGDIIASIPAASGNPQVQIGRGVNDTWRTATSYQDPDQYLYVEVGCSVTPNAGSNEHLYVYLSSTANYEGATRWYCDIGAFSNFTAVGTTTNVIECLVPLSALVRKDLDNATLVAGTSFQNFGISCEMSQAYTVRLRNMRLVSGPSQSWVTTNFETAIQGSKLPYSPGAMPFSINADTVNQQFVGWNGDPFGGYQHPNLWWYLGAEAGAVHGTMSSTDLPLPGTSTPLTYTISLTNAADSSAKPQNALLAEQQLNFIRDAQNKYHSDGGSLGPFAHTFVINTPARLQLSNPAPLPSTWVYVNADPNTRWTGYQVRGVESLARLVLDTTSTNTWSDARAIAETLCVNWLTWLNGYWTGAGVTTAGVTYYGPPSDYPAPVVTSPPTTLNGNPPMFLSDDPHSAALILRACLWLKMADSSHATLCDTLMTRCWTYMELMWNLVPTSDLNNTWSPDPVDEEWFGFWSAEIIITIADMMANSGSVPSGISMATAKARLLAHQQWLETIGVKPTI